MRAGAPYDLSSHICVCIDEFPLLCVLIRFAGALLDSSCMFFKSMPFARMVPLMPYSGERFIVSGLMHVPGQLLSL